MHLSPKIMRFAALVVAVCAWFSGHEASAGVISITQWDGEEHYQLPEKPPRNHSTPEASLTSSGMTGTSISSPTSGNNVVGACVRMTPCATLSLTTSLLFHVAQLPRDGYPLALLRPPQAAN